MRIKGIFCMTTAATNEEYRKIIKNRNCYLSVLVILGIVIAAAAYVAYTKEVTTLPEYMLGVYCGVGTGIVLGGLISLLRNLLLLKDENKLKESRIENSDERLEEISNLAMKSAIKVMLLAILAVSMIGGIYYPVLVKMLMFIMVVFFFSYLTAFRLYQRHM